MKNALVSLLITLGLILTVSGCSSPEEKAEKYYLKGMELLEKDPDKARLEFQNALQMKKVMPKATYALALIAERKGDFKTTYALMNQVLEREPTNIDALVKTGQILLAAGKVDLALERSNKAFEVDKNNVSALNLRAAIQLKLNDTKGALEYANLALSKDPNNQDAYILLATERLSAKDNLKAMEYLDQALSKNEKNLAVQLIRIKVLEDLSKVQEADQSFQKMIILFSDKSIVRKSYAQFLLKYNRQPEAEQQLRAIAEMSSDVAPKLDIVRFVIATKGPDAGRLELENFVKKEPNNYELAFALVNLYQLQKMPQQEDKLLGEIKDKAGNTPDGYKAQSMIAYKLIQAGKKEEASKMLNAILKADKSNGQALTLRAGIALEAKNYDAAISDLRTVTLDSPTAFGAMVMLASAHENSGSPQLAEEQYVKAFETSKFSPTYGIPYAQFLMRRKQPERAEKVFEDMLTANPNNPVVLRSLAQAKIARGDYAGAQALADRAKNQNDKNPLADQIEGAISIGQNDLEGALSAFKRAHDAAPNETQPIVAVVRTYMRAGKPKEALAFIDSVLKDNPNNAEAQLIKGQIYLSSGNIQGAQQILSSFVQANPKNPTGYQQLAIAQQQANQLAEAEKTIQAGLKELPNDFNLMLTQTELLVGANRIDDAIKVYEDMLKQRPEFEIASNNLANLLLDYRNDQASFARAHTLAKDLKNSTTPQFLDTYGWASYKVGEFDAAKKALESAIQKAPEIAIFQYHLAKIYIAKNDPVSAKQALQKSIKLSENQPLSQKEKDDAIALLKTL
ncbi:MULTISPECIES: tetratricopeptide repeat protein [Methylotenera]|uniref:tetratricopeptide repeat protein n=1 Tax=Methylotenera TaxID=359407 RepID=UPI000380F498|nr:MULTISPECIES: tetratricopeptide repeat protein [Methylotenera]